MKDYKTVREALEALNDLNDPNTDFSAVKEIGKDGKVVRTADIKDLQNLNSEIVASICDLLGMSDIYLGGTNYGATDKQRNDDQAEN